MSDNGKEYTIQKGTYRIIDGELVQILDNELARECLMKELIAEGWTPPPKEPEFKPGDYCIFENSVQARLGIYSQYIPGDHCPHIDERGTAWSNCKHAPTWIKWEDGEEPDLAPDGQVLGYVYTDIHGKAFLSMNDGRWAWMPEE